MIVEILFIGFIGIFIHRYKLFKLLVSYSITAMGLNLFLIIAGNIHFDTNVLLFTTLIGGLEAAIALARLASPCSCRCI